MALLEINQDRPRSDNSQLDIELQKDYYHNLAYNQYRIAETYDEYLRALVLCNRGNRAELLEDILWQHCFTQAQVNEMIRYVWTDSENIYQMRQHWENIWDLYDDPVNRRLVNRLFKQPREIYRGGVYDGMSYTLKPETAKFFSWRWLDGKDGRIMKRTVTADEVVAVFNDRREAEVILRV